MSLGARIRQTRTAKGITLQDLSDRSGLSKGFICQLENDKATPSLPALEKLANGLTVPIAYLFITQDEKIHVVRKDERPEYTVGNQNVVMHLLSANRRNLKMLMIDIPPGATVGGDSHQHDGEECHLVVEGAVRFSQGDQSVLLEAGDSLHWNGYVVHRLDNVGNTPAKVLTVLLGNMEHIMECDECEDESVATADCGSSN